MAKGTVLSIHGDLWTQFNVFFLSRGIYVYYLCPKRKTALIARELAIYKIDIAAISETHNKRMC